jgi:membrane-associated protease RseP (regulator of RpoE activity)
MRTLASSILVTAVAVAGATPAGAQQAVPAREGGGAWLGITYEVRWVTTPTGCDSRVIIAGVVPGSPAERAGLRAGDAVLSINDDSAAARRIQFLRLAPGDSVRLAIARARSTRRVVAVADRRPDRPPPTPSAATPMPRTGPPAPVVLLRGDTLAATHVDVWGAMFDGGYWLIRDDGEPTYRPLPPQPRDELDRRVADLLRCAGAESRAMITAVAQTQFQQVQARADSLRIVMAQRALDAEQAARRFVFRELTGPPPAPGVPHERTIRFMAEEALVASLRGVAGAELVTLEPELAEYFRGVREGLLVLRVAPGTPAARSGLRPGDVITGAGGQALGKPADLRALVATSDSPAVELEIVRQGRRQSVRLPR